MTVKMSEIAKAAGLALSTVSEILKGKPGYNEATRQHVLSIAQKLNYRPNPISQALSGGRSMSLGLFVTGQVTVFSVARRVQAILEEAHRAGYRVYVNHAVAPPTEAEAEGIAFIQDMMMRRVDGIIIDGSVSGDKFAETVRKVPLPFTFIGSDYQVGGVVEINRAAGIGEAARHLAALGHKEVGVILLKSYNWMPNYKMAIYCEALEAAGIKPIVSPQWDLEIGNNVAEQVYALFLREARKGSLPSAVMMNNDDCALAAMAALEAAGMRVPDDISLIGFDDLPQAKYLSPPMTTISLPCAEIGASAFRQLKAMIAHRRGETKTAPKLFASFPTHLTIRGTTGVARSIA